VGSGEEGVVFVVEGGKGNLREGEGKFLV
jgi:hypothetical protein